MWGQGPAQLHSIQYRDPGPGQLREREITKDKLPWPVEVEGRLEEFSGHGLGALNLGR